MQCRTKPMIRCLSPDVVSCGLTMTVNPLLQRMKRQIRPLLLVLACSAAMHAMAADKLELRKNDHICIIGNTLADRLQHSGWLESFIYTKFPKHDLVFRNLGFSGD